MNFFEIYYNLFLFHILFMTFAWILCIFLVNGSIVDFAWPCGFILMAINFFLKGEGYLIRKLLIFIPYLIAGFRFIYGWMFMRKNYKHEDARWNLWRERWRKGEGFLSIKNIHFNFFFFYHSQSLTNAIFMSLPLVLICNNENSHIFFLEYLGIFIWVISFILENIADYQLGDFKRNKKNKDRVMQTGLWKYSRNPNYFFEFLLWVAYSIMTIPSITETWQYIIIGLLPLVAYIFLVHFTGVPMCEKQSLLTRGNSYKEYQEKTNMFFPWFPKEQSKK